MRRIHVTIVKALENEGLLDEILDRVNEDGATTAVEVRAYWRDLVVSVDYDGDPTLLAVALRLEFGVSIVGAD